MVNEPHAWQEYNEHGYLCHYPGCQMTQEEHDRFEVTSYDDLARGERVYLDRHGTRHTEPIEP